MDTACCYGMEIGLQVAQPSDAAVMVPVGADGQIYFKNNLHLAGGLCMQGINQLNVSCDLKIDLLPYPAELDELLDTLGLRSKTKRQRKTGERIGDKTYSALYVSFDNGDTTAHEYLRLAAEGFNVAFNCKIGAAALPAVETVLFVNGIDYSLPIEDFRTHFKGNASNITSIKYYLNQQNKFMGNAFIKFSSLQSAEACIDRLNCTLLRGHKISVYMSIKQHTLVPGALSAEDYVHVADGMSIARGSGNAAEPPIKHTGGAMHLQTSSSMTLAQGIAVTDTPCYDSTDLLIIAFSGTPYRPPPQLHVYGIL